MRPTCRRQAELDACLLRAADEGITDLASLRGTMRAPTNLLQQLAEAVLDSNVSIMPEGGLPTLRRSWAAFEALSRNRKIDDKSGMVVVNDPLAAYAAAVLGLVSPGRHAVVLEPLPPQVVDVVRRVGGMARTMSMRPTDWEFDISEFAQRVSPQTDLIVLADPNPFSGEYLPDEARRAVADAAEQMDCVVLVDESARHSLVEGEAPETAEFFSALGARCIRVDVPAAAVLAQAASAASITGHPDLIAPIRSAASAFGLHASVIAQSVLARRFIDGAAIDDAATLNGMIASGRALLLDGLDDIGVLGLGGAGGWYVPVRGKALYNGPHDIGDALASLAGLGALPLAPFYVEGIEDPYVLFAYLRDGNLLENSLERLSEFSQNGETGGVISLALPAPETWDEGEDEDENEDEYDFEDWNGDGFEKMTPVAMGNSEPAVAQNPEPEIPDVDIDEGPESEPGIGDEEMRYRAAITESSRTAEKIEIEDLATSPVMDGPAPSGTEDEAQPVVLPFGRHRPARARPENESDSGAETDPDAVKHEASVFKLSVPDIVAPNIRAPEPDAGSDGFGPGGTGFMDGDESLDVVAPEVSRTPSQAASAEPSRDGNAGTADDENAKQVKRDDRPFFFDDPMV